MHRRFSPSFLASSGRTGLSLDDMRNNTLRLLAVLILSGLMIGLAGCEPEMVASPVVPGQTAYLDVEFDPSPVVEGYSDKTTVMLVIEEHFGVGAQLDEIRFEYMDDSGDVIKNETWDEYEIRHAFTTSRIEAFGKLSTLLRIKDCSFWCERLNCIVQAYDDKGRHVEYSDNVEIISR